jgi:[acyl-carrier-protein] S-malonyltransferase
MTAIAVFPGQGAQAVGMGKALYDASAAARAVFDEVDAALVEKLSCTIFEGPLDRLTLTEHAQPALMAASLAAVRMLEQALGRPLCSLVSHVAGHSLGEYSALAAAGSLPVGEAARLLRLRGSAMQRAVPAGVGAMAAILGLDVEVVDRLAAEASEGALVCAVANDNCAGQAVVSGHRAAVERAVALGKERGARRSMLLQVSAPFHCALMAPAAEELGVALARSRFACPAAPLIANVTAEPVATAEPLADLLTRQVTGRVRWRESMATMGRLGVTTVIELGPGRVLGGLARRGLPGATILSVQEPADIEPALRALTDAGAA